MFVFLDLRKTTYLAHSQPIGFAIGFASVLRFRFWFCDWFCSHPRNSLIFRQLVLHFVLRSRFQSVLR